MIELFKWCLMTALVLVLYRICGIKVRLLPRRRWWVVGPYRKIIKSRFQPCSFVYGDLYDGPFNSIEAAKKEGRT